MTKTLPVATRRSRQREQIDLFDQRPMLFDGFKFATRSVEIVGKPTLNQWVAAFQFAVATEESSPFWVGKLYNYAEGRADWRDTLQQALADSGHTMALQTLQNHGWIARNVSEEAQKLAPTITHAAVVARLPDEEQVEWMDRARQEELTVRELTVEIQARKRTKVIEGQAILRGKYRVIYADFPWIYEGRQPSKSSAQDHYRGMTVEEGCALPVMAHAMTNAVLFFWVTAPMLYYATDPEQGPDAYRIIKAWGFVPKSQIIWDKVTHNVGSYVSVRHEILIIATRGSCTPDRPTPMPDSVETERRTGGHSEKPETFRKIIERLYDGPYLELFGRKKVDRWTVFGNDAKLWLKEG